MKTINKTLMLIIHRDLSMIINLPIQIVFLKTNPCLTKEDISELK